MPVSSARGGMALIIVVAIAALLAGLSAMFLGMVRQEAASSRSVSQEAQARLMLAAGILYVQETSRLGWGAEPCFGWVDVRDGGLGPRPGVRRDGTIPPPSWWSGGGYAPSPTLALPVRSARRWPYPGSAVRCDMHAVRQPVAAVAAVYAYNPYRADLGGADQSRRAGYRMLQPQPVADDLSGFLAGDQTERPESIGIGWFRIYREEDADRDGDQRNGDGIDAPWDSVAYPPGCHTTFIIACGAGETRGFRFWDAGEAGYDPSLEPVTAAASGLFTEDQFRYARDNQLVLWYRVEWSAHTGGEADLAQAYYPGWKDLSQAAHGTWFDGNYTRNRMDTVGRRAHRSLNAFGTMRFIQRLDREPPRW